MSMIRNVHRAALAAVVLFAGGVASAQDRGPGLLDNLFNRGEPSQEQQSEQSSASDLAVRLDRIENRLRQLTGQIEQLQYRNQQLEQELARVGGAPAAPRSTSPMAPMQQGMPPQQNMPQQSMPPASTSGKRSDVFDPSQHPNAPGAPQALGGGGAMATMAAPQRPEFAVGAPGGRAAGEPLDLSTMSAAPQTQTQTASADPNGALPPPPARNTSRTGGQLATLPPSRSPKDEYDLAYGYVLHKDYALAEKAFSDFLRKYPGNELTPEAQYWLGESYFQRQRYQDAADSYLVVVRNYEKSDKAPDSLLRLGQALAAMGQKDMACASLGEVTRKYPRASASVKRGVTQEQKRVHC
jgi:tol-pal system protein YbgF